MAFDMGFDFRSTSGYVTDPSYGVPVLAETYPHTYTAANGYSINAGWSAAPNALDRVNTNDPRIAGANWTSTSKTFQVDLSSGSAPGAGDYSVDIAAGDPGNSNPVNFDLKDNTTSLIYRSGYFGLAANEFMDATLTEVTATTTWTGTPVTKTFASTTANLVISPDNVGFSMMAHFRLTLEEGLSGSAAITLDALTSSATGTLPIAGVAAATLGALTATATGVLPIAGVAALTLDGLTSTATGALSVAGVAAITLDDLAGTATGALAITGSLDASLAALTLQAYEAPPAIGAGAGSPAPFRYVRGRGRPL